MGDFLRNHLLESVMPFWMRHAIDPAGGLNSCIADDGKVISRDKWLWSQWRAVWVFSALYEMIEPNEKWLETAWHIYDFAAAHGWDDNIGGWALLLDGEGRVQRGCDSIYVDAFAIYGCTALARVTGDERPLALAKKTADHALRRLQQPHDQIPHFPYPIPPGMQVHGIPMMFSLMLWELGQLADDDRYRTAAIQFSDQVFNVFYRSDRDLLLERVMADGSPGPSPEGTMVNPGHVIEDMWFQILIARDRGDTKRIDEAVRLIERHMAIGWDDEYGGLFQAIDIDGGSEVAWPMPESKLWWPHTEAMIGLLMAYEHSHADWCLSWYDRVHEYSFSHYPVAEHGEWVQKLDRFGKPFSETVALPVKDPFHLPRALIYCVTTLERLSNR